MAPPHPRFALLAGTQRRTYAVLAAAVISACALVGVTALAAPEDRTRSVVAQAAGELEAQPAAITIGGAVAKGGELTGEELAAFEQRSTDATYLSRSGEQKHSYTGALLREVLLAAEPTFDAADRHDPLRFVILVRASDGFEVTFSWSELAEDQANVPVLLARTEDGQVLDRPQLATPSDSHGARYIHDITEINLIRLTTEADESPADSEDSGDSASSGPTGEHGGGHG